MTNFDPFIDLVHSIEDRELLADFLVGVTTEKERAELLQRVEVTKRLIAGQPQAQIARELGVGVATVTRGSKVLAQNQLKVLREQ